MGNKQTPPWMVRTWNWFSTGKNLAITAVFCTALWQFYTHFLAKPTPTTTQIQVTHGISLRDHEAGLKRRETELREEYANTALEDKARVEKELNAVIHKLTNLNESYQKRIDLLEKQNASLEKLRGRIPEEQLLAAKAALASGDSSKAEELFQHVQDEAGESAAEAAFQIGLIAEENVNYLRALGKYERACQLQPDHAEYLYHAGHMANLLADYDKAVDYYEQTLELEVSALSEDSEVGTIDGWPYLAAGIGLGDVYREQALFDASIESIEYTRQLVHSKFGDKTILESALLAGLGIAWGGKGDWDKALDYHQKALQIDLEKYDEGSLKIAHHWVYIGVVWGSKGQLHYNSRYEAIYLNKALEVYLTVYGETHPRVASTWINVGTNWHHRGEIDRAIEYYNKALEINIDVYGEEHPKVALNWNNLGTALADKGEYRKSVDYLEKALSVYERSYDENHPKTLLTRENLEETRRALVGLENVSLEHQSSTK